jgi:hypothetical protein
MADRFVDAAVAAIRDHQLGLVTLEQARSAGMTIHQVRHRLETGQLVAVRRGVYADPGAPASEERRILGAVLAAGDGAFASHDSACWLWGLPLPGAMRLEITTGPDRRPRAADVEWHRSYARSRDVVVVGAIPVSTVERAIAEVSKRYGVDELAAMVTGALVRELTNEVRLARVVGSLAPVGVRDRDRLRQALALAA